MQEIPFKRSRYFFDFMQYARGFAAEAQFDPLFGDVIDVPGRPRIVKSRPLNVDNSNSVLFPLDKFRHFGRQVDRIPFRDKKPSAVWRGALNSPERLALVEQHSASLEHDIGYVGAGGHQEIAPKAFLSPEEQIKHKFLLSVEGIDVATNLKWMMGTNCLILSPPLRFESWYMEGALVPGVHFVQLAADCSDLEETVAYYLANPDEAEAIIQNAQAWRASFDDPYTEALVATRVLQIYLEHSGQL